MSNHPTYKCVSKEEDVIIVTEAEAVNDGMNDGPAGDDARTTDPYSTEDEENESNGRKSNNNAVTTGAAALCGISGCLLCGPFVAVLAAIGAAFAAKSNKGAVGDASQACGEVAIAAAEKAREVEVLGKSKKAVSTAAREVRDSFNRAIA